MNTAMIERMVNRASGNSESNAAHPAVAALCAAALAAPGGPEHRSAALALCEMHGDLGPECAAAVGRFKSWAMHGPSEEAHDEALAFARAANTAFEVYGTPEHGTRRAHGVAAAALAAVRLSTWLQAHRGPAAESTLAGAVECAAQAAYLATAARLAAREQG